MDKIARQSKDYVNQLGASRSSILSAVKGSLERLQTSYVDVLHLHRYDSSVAPEETMQTLHQLVVDGKVRYLAASSMWAYQFAMLQAAADKNGWTKFVAMQNHYNLLYREEEREMNRYCRETGVGLLPWSPLAEGALARPLEGNGYSARSLEPSRFGNEYSETDRVIISRVHAVAKRRGWTMSQVALAWLNKRVTAPIVGLHSVKRIEEALMARGIELNANEEAYLEEPYKPKCVQGHA
ncbi:hypothetical protein DL764_008692 [Monosporascus ibericus]|uniref:NADP-dependent oxidoreductase domain-containing protein n=1 Tax=Monosporascus ibericus TaxID=155417 RepID=A0A4Q4SWU5_9PEZI|nr:hypothetical protein DL764_008692 [Monosporascus ibericus]